MRQIEIYYDVDNDILRDEDGNQINSQLYPFIYFEENAIAQVQLQNADGTDYTKLSGTYSVSATIDNDFDADDDALCKTLNANINVAGDWKSGGNANIANGEISIRLDADNTNYETKIGSSKKLNAFLEIQVRDSGDDSLTAVFEFPYECRNLRDQTGTVPPSPTSNYYTKTEADAIVDGRVEKTGDTMSGNLDMTTADILTDDIKESTADAGVTVEGVLIKDSQITLVNDIDEFSTDGTLSDNSDTALPTEKAVKTYIDQKTEAIQIACSDLSTALTTGTSKAYFRMPYAMTLTDVRASLLSAGSTSGTTTIDINEGGTSVLSTKLTIDFGDTTSVGATDSPVISDSALADDAIITIDIDAITGGADEVGLIVTLIGTRA